MLHAAAAEILQKGGIDRGFDCGFARVRDCGILRPAIPIAPSIDQLD